MTKISQPSNEYYCSTGIQQFDQVLAESLKLASKTWITNTTVADGLYLQYSKDMKKNIKQTFNEIPEPDVVKKLKKVKVNPLLEEITKLVTEISTNPLTNASLAQPPKVNKWYTFNEGTVITVDSFLGLVPELSKDSVFVKCYAVAVEAHKEQKRKDGVTPYIVHPVAVSVGIYNYLRNLHAWKDQAVYGACVAVLHDVLEDAKDPAAMALKIHQIDPKILVDVYALTNIDGELKALPRTVRKLIDSEKFKYASPIVKLIKISDRIHNLYKTLPNDEFTRGPNAVYLKESLDLLKAICRHEDTLKPSEISKYLTLEESPILYPRITWLLILINKLMEEPTPIKLKVRRIAKKKKTEEKSTV